MVNFFRGNCVRSILDWDTNNYLGAKKKTNKQKTHKHFSDRPCGTIVPGTNPHPSQGQTGQNGDFTVGLNRKRPVCPRDRSQFVPGRDPVCPRDGSCLSWTPSLPKCLFLLAFSCPNYYNLALHNPGRLVTFNLHLYSLLSRGHAVIVHVCWLMTEELQRWLQ